MTNKLEDKIATALSDAFPELAWAVMIVQGHFLDEADERSLVRKAKELGYGTDAESDRRYVAISALTEKVRSICWGPSGREETGQVSNVVRKSGVYQVLTSLETYTEEERRILTAFGKLVQ